MLLTKESTNILFYNWQRVFEVAQGNPLECYRIFKMLVNKEIPENIFDPIFRYYSINFDGDSFLLNPDSLLYYSYKYSLQDITLYLALASLRPINDFINDGKVELELIKAPIDPRDYIKDKELIYVKDDIIHFLYEEVPDKELH
jgi:hypothetical protein